MRKLIFVLLFLVQFSAAMSAQGQQTVTGTYRYKSGERANEIKVLQTGASEIKVSFEGVYQYKIPGGYLNTRTGGIAPQTVKLEKGRAVLTTEDAPACRITLTFTKSALKVVQNADDCGFAIGVDANGIYRRTSAAELQFSYELGFPPEAILEDLAGKASNSSSKRVRFPKGADSVMIADTIACGSSAFYLVASRRGQTINVQLIDDVAAENKVVVSVAGKNGSQLKVNDDSGNFFSGRTLENADYVITVKAAGTQNANFKILVSIY
jgi:hypothetical protein